MADLQACITTFNGGGMFNDIVSPQLAQMTANAATLAATPANAAVAASINTAVSALSTQWSTHLASLPVALPVMKAVHLQESKLQMSNGGMAPASGSTSFTAFMNAHTSIQTEIGTLSASVANLVKGTGTAATVTAQLTSSQANVTGFISTASSTFTAGVTGLKSMAFAKFCSSPQSAAVSGALNSVVNMAVVPNKAVFDRASASVSQWLKGQPTASDGTFPKVAKAASPDAFTLSPTIPPSQFTASPCSTAQLNAINAQIDAQTATVKADAAAADASAAPFIAWQTSVNYQSIKNNSVNGPNAMAAYTNLKAQALAHPAYLDMQAKMVTYNADKKKLSDLNDVSTYMRTIGPWPGNANGPW